MSPDDEFTHEDEHKTDVEGGDWTSGGPPVDDFGDAPTEETSENATVSEGVEHAEDAAAPVVKEKKKFPVTIIVGLVGFLAIAGGVAYWQFGGHNQEQVSILDMAAQKAAEETMPSGASKPATLSTNAADNVAQTSAFGSPSSSGNAPPQQMGAVTPSAPVAASVSPSLAPANNVSPDSGNIPAASGSANDARLTALSSRIDDLQKSLAQATQQLGQINEKLAESSVQPPASASASTQPDPAMMDRLGKLEQKMMQIEQQQQQPGTPPVRSSVSTTHHEHHARSSRSYAYAPRHRTVHHASSALETQPTASSSQILQEPGASSGWVLRAATMDEAWVAKGATTRQLRPVHVGDELAGIGRITSIQQEGSGWVVQGTAGTIQ